MNPLLPFEIGFISGMDAREMIAIADELMNSNFWEEERHINSIVEDFMECQWRQPSAHPSATYMPYLSPSPAYLHEGDVPQVSTSAFRHIHINVPDCLDERTARLFARMQVQEQLRGYYDPRYADE
jgi:hypothetical protein